MTSDLLVMCIPWKATYKTSRETKVLGQGSSLSFYVGYVSSISVLDGPGRGEVDNVSATLLLATLNILHEFHQFRMVERLKPGWRRPAPHADRQC